MKVELEGSEKSFISHGIILIKNNQKVHKNTKQGNPMGKGAHSM